MTERRDDTTKPETESHPPRERKPGSYYYDDATGYEIYMPEEDEDVSGGKEIEETGTNDDGRGRA